MALVSELVSVKYYQTFKDHLSNNNNNASDIEKINAFFWLVILITILLFFTGFCSWIIFLIFGVILLFLTYKLKYSKQLNK